VGAENISKQGRSSHCSPLDGIHSRVIHIQATSLRHNGRPAELAMSEGSILSKKNALTSFGMPV